MIIVAQHDEEGLELATKAIADNLIDQGEVLVGKIRGQGRHGLDEVVRPEASIGRPGWHSGDSGSGVIALDTVRRS